MLIWDRPHCVGLGGRTDNSQAQRERRRRSARRKKVKTAKPKYPVCCYSVVASFTLILYCVF